MSNFFENFPLVNYTFGDEGIRSIFQNISAYTDIFQALIDDDTQYETYQVTDIDRPDTLSYALYDTPEFYWTFYLLNPDLITRGWPISENELYAKKEDLFPEFGFQIRYNPRFDSDDAPWDQFYGVGDTFGEIYKELYGRDNNEGLSTFFNIVKPGTIVEGFSGSSYNGVSCGVVTQVDYNSGIFYVKGWNGLYGIAVLDGGTGYDVPPKVIIEGTGKNAYAEALVDSSGAVSEVRVYKPGYDFEPWPWDGKTWRKYPWTGGPFRSVEGTLREEAENFLKAQISVIWFVDSDLLKQYFIDLNVNKVRFERQSDQKGRDAVAYPIVNDMSLLGNATSLKIYNFPISYKDWDFRTYANGPKFTISQPYNLFQNFGNAGAFVNATIIAYGGDSSYYEDNISLRIAQNPENKPGVITYKDFNSYLDSTFTVTCKSDGTADLPPILGSGADSPDYPRIVPEKFIDYSEPSRVVEETSVYLGQKKVLAGLEVLNWSEIFFIGGGVYRNLSIYNATQGYYDSPMFDPLYNFRNYSSIEFLSDPFKKHPTGTVTLTTSSDGRVGNYVSGLTGDSGDVYNITLAVGPKGREERWDNPAHPVGTAANLIHHWEDNNLNRINFNLFDSNSAVTWYSFYDSQNGIIGNSFNDPGSGNYDILDSMSGSSLGYSRVTHFENLLRQAAETREIKVLKPDSVRKIANAFKKAIRGTNR